MALTDEQCADIAAWSRTTYPAPRIVVSREQPEGDPLRTPLALYAHPEDYLAIRNWAERQARGRWDLP